VAACSGHFVREFGDDFIFLRPPPPPPSSTHLPVWVTRAPFCGYHPLLLLVQVSPRGLHACAEVWVPSRGPCAPSHLGVCGQVGVGRAGGGGSGSAPAMGCGVWGMTSSLVSAAL
jgi:hypothetical protein